MSSDENWTPDQWREFLKRPRPPLPPDIRRKSFAATPLMPIHSLHSSSAAAKRGAAEAVLSLNGEGPVLVGLFLFGPAHQEVFRFVQQLLWRLDRHTAASLLLTYFGHPGQAGPVGKAALQRLHQKDEGALHKEWEAQVADVGDRASARALRSVSLPKSCHA